MSTFTAEPRDVEAAFSTVFPHVGAAEVWAPVLQVVHVEAAGECLLLSATDRYTAAMYRADVSEWLPKPRKDAAEVVEQEPLDEIVVDLRAADLRRLFTFARGQRKAPARWALTADRLAVELADGSQLSIRAVEGLQFPKLRAIFEQNATQPDEVTRVVNVNPDKLARFSASAERLGGQFRDGYPVVNVWPAVSPLKPIIVTIGARFAGLILPVRVEQQAALDLGPVIAAPAAAPAALPAGGTA